MRSKESRSEGYSLTELLVGCAVLGLVLAAAVPNLRSYRESQRMAAAGEQVAAACRAARARARSENHNVVIEYRPEENSFAVIDDENSNGTADAGEGVNVRPLPDGLTLQATTFPGDRLVFDGRGHATSGGNVLLAGRAGVLGRTVRVSSGTGQVKIRSGSGS